MQKLYSFKLPELPPSVNGLYVRSRYGVRKSERVAAFDKMAYYTLARPKKTCTVPCRLEITFTFKTPSKLRNRDVDNMLKVLLDALQYREVFEDDALVYELSCRKVQGKADGVDGALYELKGEL